ncbi:MAG: hypothetical protein NVS9B1_07350 [Candidatus Dormibacteraceae bacterium]
MAFTGATYARSGDVCLAYQVVGEGRVDLVLVLDGSHTWRTSGSFRRSPRSWIELYAVFAAESGRRPEELSAEERQRLAELALPVALPNFGMVPGSGRTPESIEVAKYVAVRPTAFSEVARPAGYGARLDCFIGESPAPARAAAIT